MKNVVLKNFENSLNTRFMGILSDNQKIMNDLRKAISMTKNPEEIAKLQQMLVERYDAADNFLGVADSLHESLVNFDNCDKNYQEFLKNTTIFTVEENKEQISEPVISQEENIENKGVVEPVFEVAPPVEKVVQEEIALPQTEITEVSVPVPEENPIVEENIPEEVVPQVVTEEHPQEENMVSSHAEEQSVSEEIASQLVTEPQETQQEKVSSPAVETPSVEEVSQVEMTQLEKSALPFPEVTITPDAPQESPNISQEEKTTFVKTGNEEVRGIIVGRTQFDNLKKSKETQSNLFKDNFQNSTANMNANEAENNMEAMMQEINELYKQGEAKAAEELSAKIFSKNPTN